MLRVKALFSLTICLFLFGTLQAQQLEFSVDGGATFSNQFTANVGDTTTVGVFLTDSAAGQAATEGLASFGIEIQHDTGLGNLTSIAPASPFVPNPASPVTLTSSGGTIEGGSFPPNPTGTSIALASIDFVSTGAGVTNFTVSDVDPTPGISGANFNTALGNQLDGAIFAAGNSVFTISSLAAVPEPSSALLLVAACSGFLLRRKRQ